MDEEVVKRIKERINDYYAKELFRPNSDKWGLHPLVIFRIIDEEIGKG